jgi:hypothetical protein
VAEIRGGQRAQNTGHHSHLPHQKISECLIGQDCLAWPLLAERQAGKGAFQLFQPLEPKQQRRKIRKSWGWSKMLYNFRFKKDVADHLL